MQSQHIGTQELVGLMPGVQATRGWDQSLRSCSTKVRHTNCLTLCTPFRFTHTVPHTVCLMLCAVPPYALFTPCSASCRAVPLTLCCASHCAVPLTVCCVIRSFNQPVAHRHSSPSQQQRQLLTSQLKATHSHHTAQEDLHQTVPEG